VVGYSKKTALLEDAITQMNAGKYGRSSAALKELLALDPHNMEARRLFATLHLRLGSLIPARQAFDSLISEAFERQDYWLAESLLREYLAAGPRCVPFIEKLGSVYQEKGDALEAVAEYGKAIDILIEDPDPENPQHAAQLYAKIRELAPASPVAFRHAPLFDAQTGDLIARPQPVPSDPSVSPVEPPVAGSGMEPNVADAVMPEAAVGVMPWEEGIEEPSSRPAQQLSPEMASAATTGESPAVPRENEFIVAELKQGDPVVEMNLPQEVAVVDEPPPAQPAVHVNDATFDTTDTTIEAHSSSAVPTDRAPSASVVASAEETLSRAVDIAPTPLDLPEPPATKDQGSPAPEVPQASSEETISAPMPWEEVQESTVTIPEAASFDPAPLSTQSHDEVMIQSETAPREEMPTPAQPTLSSPLAGMDSPAAQQMAEPSAAQSDTAPAAHSPIPDVLKGGFSWESVFNSAWKFGDKVSINQPEAAAPQVDHAEDGEAPQPLASSSARLPTTGSLAEVAPTVMVSQPMPWEQVQEAVVTIPPPDAVEETAVENGAAVVDQPARIEPAGQPTGAASSPTSASAIDTFSISEPPPAPPSAEPEFRFVVTDAVNSPTPSPVSDEKESSASEAQHDSESSVSLSSPSVLQPEPVLKPFSSADSEDGASHGVPKAAVEQETPPLYAAEPADVRPTVEEIEAPVHETAVLIGQTTPEPPLESSPQSPASQVPAAPVEAEHPAAEISDGSTQSFAQEPGIVASSPGAPAEISSMTIPLSEQIDSPRGTGFTEPPAALNPVAESVSPGLSAGDLSHWKTGEVAVQTHRPTPKKRKKTSQPQGESSAPLLPREEPVFRTEVEEERQSAQNSSEEAPNKEPVPQQEEWIRTGESIRFVEPAVSVAEAVPEASAQVETRAPTPLSTAASAVDVLFESSGRFTKTAKRERSSEPKPRPRLRTKLSRVRIAITVFLSSCFSTTRAIVTSIVALIVLSAALAALAVGAVGLTWMIMEEAPSPAFHSLTTIPQRALADSKKNGYLLLLGFEAPVGLDPIQAGYERKPDRLQAGQAAACLGGSGGAGGVQASAAVAKGWFKSADPVGQFKSHQDTIKGWTTQGETALTRYKQWVKLAFEDWGYGQSVTPPCSAILFAHQLYLAEGFLQNPDTGLDRLETDMEAWRVALAQAKTLPMKMMALQAVRDDAALASGLLVKPDFDGKMLGRLTKILRPLDQVELSIRWPMQGELVSAVKTFDAQLKAERGEDPRWYTAIASALPLPKQRRFNDYAEYYEVSYKAAGEGRYASMPKWAHYLRYPAQTVMDYLGNPIENIIGLEPLAAWDHYNGLVVDADAHLRLVSLQAWLRRGPQDADLLPRIAKAGQSVYDPYTGLPMLVNLKKGVLYSVGHDGKDQDADPQDDVVVAIPLNQSPAVFPRTVAGPIRTK
jgi:hypothetical protein